MLVWFSVAGALGLLAGCNRPTVQRESQGGPPEGGTTNGTKRMVERLEKMAREADPDGNIFLNHLRAERLRAKITPDLPPQAAFDLRLQTALEYLRAGETEVALEDLTKLPAMVPLMPQDKQHQMSWFLNQALGLAYMRLGEQENCVSRHTSESCLVPIGRGGVHDEQKGSRNAIEYFTKALAGGQQDLRSAWLLNIAFMTLGEYPDKVPGQWLVRPHVGRFIDVAPELGLDARGHAGGAIMEDFDNDGFLDIVKSSWGLRDQMQFFRNNGDGTFTERTKEAGLVGIVGGLNMVHADYDNDGYRDILVLRGAWLGTYGRHPMSLLRNNGDGTFADVTEEAGLLSLYPRHMAVWFDYDGDGWLDLFVGNESNGAGHGRHPCELFRNNHNGRFTECAAACGVAHVGFVKGVTAGDYDNDGRPDLYLSCFFETNVLYRNAGPQGSGWKFEDMTSAAGVAEPIESFPTWFFDYDNDGWLDLFVASYTGEASMEKVAADYLGIPNPGPRPRLYHNNGNGTFADVTKACHLDRVLVVMGANFGDLDNDGWLDFYLGTGEPILSSLMPNRMFHNAEGKFFQDVTTSGGFGHLQKGHGIAWGDIDNDGDQDIFEVLGGAYEGDVFQSALFHNPGHGNHWVTVRLRGVRSNRDAIGARIAVEVQEADPVGASGAEAKRTRKIHSLVSTGGSFGSSSLQQEIGLGRATSIQHITIQWPLAGRPTQVITNVPMDCAIEIKEGEPGFRVTPQKRFPLVKPVQSASAQRTN